ncbi:MAG: hypothetical protein NTX87_15735 [Planctomycetota bacterium]|nr:hypothetical protein [Planctomycetota bacterium]
MRTLKTLAVALAVVAWATDALAQYYVPLRYDMRYTPNPGYISPVPYAQAPPRADPYAFGSAQYGNYDITGNVRAGKSFRGSTPFGQQGSQISTRLPSLRLSNFTRDSIGIEDIGTGVEHGAALPYFPGSGSVTSITTAKSRFATPPPMDRAPYALPGVNSAMPGYTAVPGSFAGSAPPPMVSPQQAAGYRPGLYVPRGAVEWVNAMVEGRGGAPPVDRRAPTVSPGLAGETPQERKMDLRLGLPLMPADARIGIWTAGSETGQAAPPEAGGPAAPAAEGAPAAPADLFQSPLYWRLREAATTDKPPARREEPPFLLTPPKPRTTAADGPGEERDLAGEPQAPAIPALIEKLPTTPASYADYLARAQAARKANQYGAADSLFQAAMVMDPDQPEPFFGRVSALLGDYRYLQAALVLDRGLKTHPEWARSIPDAKTGYSKPEVYDRIVGELAEDLKNRPEGAETNLLLGYLSLASGKTEDARAYLKQVALVRGDRAGSERAMLDAIASAGAAK